MQNISVATSANGSEVQSLSDVQLHAVFNWTNLGQRLIICHDRVLARTIYDFHYYGHKDYHYCDQFASSTEQRQNTNSLNEKITTHVLTVGTERKFMLNNCEIYRIENNLLSRYGTMR